MATLVELSGPERRCFELGPVTALGRDSGCAIPIWDPLVSRQHAEIRRDPDGRYRIVHVKGTNGTYVEGESITQAMLSDGSEIVVGNTRFLFQERDTRSTTLDEVRMSTSIPMVRVHQRKTAPPMSATEVKTAGAAELRWENERLRAAYDVGRAVAEATDLDDLLRIVLDQCLGLLPAERGAILLMNSDSGQLAVRAASERSSATGKLVISKSVINEVIDQRTGVVCTDATTDKRFRGARSIMFAGACSIMCVPLKHRGEFLGVMHLESRLEHGIFQEKDLELFMTIAGQAELALKNETLRHRMRIMEQEQRERFESLLQYLPVGVVLLDDRHRIIYTNRVGQKLVRLWTSPESPAPLTHVGAVPLDTVLSESAGTAFEVEIEADRTRTLAIQSTRLYVEQRESVLVLRDLTEQREHDRRAQTQEQLAILGKLAAGVAHELNQPLNNIKLVAQDSIRDIEKQRLDVQELELGLREVVTHVNRGAAIIANIRTFGRPVLGDDSRPVDANQELERAMAMLETKFRLRNVKTSVDMGTIPAVKAQAGKLQQIVINLLQNALDAFGSRVEKTQGEDCLSIASFVRDSGEVELTVQDNAGGIPEELQDRLFEPFFTTKPVGEGMGLGLSICQRIAEQFGARLEFEVQPNVGTTFSIVLVPYQDSSGDQ